MNENEKFKKGILEILNAIGIHVHDVVVEKKMIEPGSLSLMCMANPQNLLMSQYTHDYTAKLVYNDFSTNLISEESSGIQKLFSLFYPLYDAVKNDKVLICYELEAFLHPNLICKIVEIFSTVLSKESNAQLITTTHCLDVLNIKSLRRDQVYFTDFKKDRSTELYSLDNIKGVRKTEDFRRFYRHGDYGAIPTYTDDFIHRVCEFVFSKKSTEAVNEL